MTALGTAASREIRVFLSSTFKDMQAERGYLLSHVFPPLRALCAQREVVFTEIDLRWGVTEEARKNGLTIELCLEEIERCRLHPPFFIGFLGERYGWVPTEEDLRTYWQTHKDSPYAERIQKALATGISVTELEMQYAFLDNPTAVDDARVFLRSPELTKKLSDQAGNAVLTDFYDPAGGKLDRLKDLLRQQPSIVGLDGYKANEEFGKAVEKFLRGRIDATFPEGQTPTPQQRRDNAHRVYAASRRQAYVPLPALRKEMLTALQQALEGKAARSPRIVLQGESGSGKSAFVADLETWLPSELRPWTHAHYVGADGDRSLDGWIERLLLALQATGHLQKEDIPQDGKERWEFLPDALYRVQKALNQPLVLLLDAVDQLRESNAWSQLSFLPLPPQVILLASTTSQPAPVASRWQHLTLRPLEEEADRREAIRVFLDRYGKKLKERIIAQIVNARASSSPLYLRLLLEEIRVHALHETLLARVSDLLNAGESGKLFRDIIAALDQDYNHPSQVEETTLGIATLAATLLAVSSRGLGHIELARLLATANDPKDPADDTPRVPDLILSALLARLDPFCLQEDGRLFIMHNILAEALRKGDCTAAARRKLVVFFAKGDGRALAERSYQLWQLGDTESLVGTLGDPHAILSLWRTDTQLLRELLGFLGAGNKDLTPSLHTLAQQWDAAFGALDALPADVDLLAVWLTHNAYRPIAEKWLLSLLNWRRQQGIEGEALAINLNNLAGLYQAQGRLGEAEPPHRQALKTSQKALPPGHPGIATSLNNLASLYQAQGRLGEAELLYRQALETFQQALPPGHPRIATSLNNLAGLYKTQGRLGEAEPLYRQALEIRQQALPPGHPDIAMSLNNLALLYQAQGFLDKAEPLYRQALEIRQQALPPGHPDIAGSLNNLAGLYKTQGFLDKVEPLYRQALEILQQALPPGHPDIAGSLNNLAFLYQAQGFLDKAEPLYRQALEILQQALPPGHPDIAMSLNNLASLYQAQGFLDKAEPLYRQALEIRQQALPAGHPGIATSLNNLAGLYKTQGFLDKAEPLYRQALEIRQQALPPGHPDIAGSLSNLALLYQAQGFLDKAEPLHRQALEIRQQALPPSHPDIATSLNNLALLYQDQGFLDKAEPLYRQALEIRQQALPPSHPDIATSLNNLALLYQDQGFLDKAEPLYRQALDIDQQALPAGHPDIATSLNNLAGLYQDQGFLDKAEPLYRQALEIRQQALPPGHPDIAGSLSNLALLYQAQGFLDKAEPLHRQALEIRQQALPPGHPDIATSLNNLALLYQAQGFLDKAEPLHRQALEILQQALPAGHPDIARSLNNLASLYRAQGRLGEAEPLYRQALESLQQALPPNHLDIATSHFNLAVLYYTLRRLNEAELHARRALQIYQKALPVGHPYIVQTKQLLDSIHQA